MLTYMYNWLYKYNVTCIERETDRVINKTKLLTNETKQATKDKVTATSTVRAW